MLNGLAPTTLGALRAGAVDPRAGLLPEISEWAEFCRLDRAAHPAALHIDTGMNRLGLSARDLPHARAFWTPSSRCWR